MDVANGASGGFCTLGSVVGVDVANGTSGVFRTLGSVEPLKGSVGESSIGCDVGTGVALCSSLAIFIIAFLVSSPTSKVGTVDDCVLVSIVTMSSADCLKKSSKLTSGNGILLGKNVTVSVCRSVLVAGK